MFGEHTKQLVVPFHKKIGWAINRILDRFLCWFPFGLPTSKEPSLLL